MVININSKLYNLKLKSFQMYFEFQDGILVLKLN